MKFNKLIPELSVSNVQRSLSFYVDTLGFRIEYARLADMFYFLSYQGSQLMIEEVNDNWSTGELEHPFGRGVNFQMEVGDVSALAKRLDEADVTLFRPVKESWYRGEDAVYGQLEFLVQDPDGYLLRFIQEIGERKPE